MKNKKGISLIVLVITIIIMIILAGSIILSLQSSGIIGRADEAVRKSNIANKKQAINMAYGEWMLDNPNKVFTEADIEDLNQYLPDNMQVNGDGNMLIIVEDGKPIDPEALDIMPSGFYYVGGTKEEGFVISDNKLDRGRGVSHEVAAELEGNQFVWVPVEDFSKFVRENFNSNQTINFSTTPKEANKYFEILPTEGGTNEVDKMYQSVKKYKGFYVARYEAGIAEGMPYTVSDVTDTYGNGEYKPRSKANVQVWRSIRWGGEYTETASDGGPWNDEGNGAVKVARNMYTSSDNKGVVSHLIYGVQWDAIMRWYSNSGINVVNCTDWGNYYNATGDAAVGAQANQKSGSNAAWNKKNIYDIAGNIKEWTMENYSTGGRTYRGGTYNGGDPASHRATFSASYGDAIGFRIALYIK